MGLFLLQAKQEVVQNVCVIFKFKFLFLHFRNSRMYFIQVILSIFICIFYCDLQVINIAEIYPGT